jgi:hypothetical protein
VTMRPTEVTYSFFSSLPMTKACDCIEAVIG